MMTSYNLAYLEEKLGKFKKEYKYPTKPISGFNLIYIESKTKTLLDKIVKEIKEEINPGYIWGYVKDTNAIYVTRAFGENKVFIYNPTAFKKTDYVKGKLKVLNNLTEDKINDLFDQKAVFDYFYRKLWNLRLDLGKEIRDKNEISDNKALMGAQYIIDRIIFTYFLCEKELVTLNGETPLDSKTLFNSIAKMPDPWKCLKNLFFEQFAKKESKPLFLGKNAQIITPYLNGGLFRPKIIEKTSEIDLIIEYTREQWQEIFNPLNKYTWIIEDKIPDQDGEYEGNLTPEIIGHIYEKFVISIEELGQIDLDELNISVSGDLKKGNKKIGAYYTPEHITEYISRSIITSHIFNEIGIEQGSDFYEYCASQNSSSLQKILEILNNITICDPACGSGAFLIKTGEILLEFKISILKELNVLIDRYMLKKQIIIKNLYGVDIQEGAVEICKLRLWLWLISSSKNQHVEPLPNIEYNFLVGNSLVGWTNEKLEQSVLVKLDDMILLLVDALKIHYKTEDIDKIKLKLQKTDMKSYAEAMSLLKNIYSYSTEEEAEQLKNIIENIRIAIYKKINGIFYNFIKSKGIKISQKDYEELRPLHWEVDFNQIFYNGGFNVIIGNPPYVSQKGSLNDPKIAYNERFYYRGMYKTLSENEMKTRGGVKLNLFGLWIERSLDLLGNRGHLGLIVHKNLLKVESYKYLRKYILEKTSIIEIVDLGANVFEGVTGETILAFFENKKVKDNKITIKTNVDFVNNSYDIDKISQDNFYKNIDYTFNIYETESIVPIKNKMQKYAVKLEKIYNIVSFGLNTSNNKEYFSNKKLNKSYKKSVMGRNIDKWVVKSFGYVFYDDSVLTRKGDLEAFKSEKLILQRIGANLIAAFDDDQLYCYNSTNMILSSDEEFDLKYLLCILNSRLMNFYYKNIFSMKSKLTVNVTKGYLAQLPIRNIDLKNQQKFIDIANKIIISKKELIMLTNSFKKMLQDEYKIEKFSNKLENYYQLSYENFIKELKKKKIEIISHDTLKMRFNENINKVNQKINQIKVLNNKVDSMVYELYYLSEDEINIVKEG